MKILHLTNYYPPHDPSATESQCFKVVNQLMRRGHKVRVLTSTHLEPGVRARQAGVSRSLHLVNPSNQFEKKTSLGHLYSCQKNNHFLLEAISKDFYPDVIILWNLIGVPRSILWSAISSGIPCVIAIHDTWLIQQLNNDAWTNWWKNPLPTKQAIIRSFLKLSGLSHLIKKRYPIESLKKLVPALSFFCSRDLQQMIHKRGFAFARGEVIPHCVSTREIAIKRFRSNKLYRLLIIDPVDKDHDPLTAIKAILKLRDAGHNRFSLDIFGNGERSYKNQLQSFIHKHRLEASVRIGNIPSVNLPMLFLSYDILLYTAKKAAPFPDSIIKAMAAKLPVISTPDGSCRDLIRDGENSLSFHRENPSELSDCILKIAHDPDLVERLTYTAHRDFRMKYSVESVTSKIENILHAARRRARFL
ncbi:MAG: glycosyltransferase family 4 protein [Opitutaceae bacterium]|nr:glycosyltransferase family 4 protein [Opitutaceae bacterium]